MSEELNQNGKETEMKEFVSDGVKGTDRGKKMAEAGRDYTRRTVEFVKKNLFGNQPLSILVLYAVLAAVVILISMIALKVPIVSVCLIVVIEALLAICLHNLPIWLHGAVMILEFVFGIIFGRTVFMILMAFLYLGAILTLQYLRREGQSAAGKESTC